MMLRKYCKSTQRVSTLCTLITSFTLLGCYSRNPNSIPDAPPPYPSFPFPQENFQSNDDYNSARPEQNSNRSLSSKSQIPVESSLGIDSEKNYNYIPPSAPPPSSSLQTPAFSSLSRKTDNPRFTLTANGDLWALVQDGKGNEIEWLKMKTGESAFIYDPNALVITCSSGNLLSIKNSGGKNISFDSRGNGISIIRLPK